MWRERSGRHDAAAFRSRMRGVCGPAFRQSWLSADVAGGSFRRRVGPELAQVIYPSRDGLIPSPSTGVAQRPEIAKMVMKHPGRARLTKHLIRRLRSPQRWVNDVPPKCPVALWTRHPWITLGQCPAVVHEPVEVCSHGPWAQVHLSAELTRRRLGRRRFQRLVDDFTCPRAPHHCIPSLGHVTPVSPARTASAVRWRRAMPAPERLSRPSPRYDYWLGAAPLTARRPPHGNRRLSRAGR